MRGLMLPSLEGGAWVGRSAPLMSPAQTASGLLLYFVDLTAPPKLLAGALASCHHRAVRGGRAGRMAERSKGGGMGEAHDGGHEYSHAPRLSAPFNAPIHHLHQRLKEHLT